MLAFFQGTANEEVTISWAVFSPEEKVKMVEATCVMPGSGFAEVVFDAAANQSARCMPS
jgi:hypothetical protein